MLQTLYSGSIKMKDFYFFTQSYPFSVDFFPNRCNEIVIIKEKKTKET